MENKIKIRLMEIKRKMILNKTVFNYTEILSNLFLGDITLFKLVCDTYDLTYDELLDILNQAEYKNLAFLDELVQFSYEFTMEKEKEMGNRLRR